MVENDADSLKLTGDVQGTEHIMPILTFKLLSPEYLGIAQLETSQSERKAGLQISHKTLFFNRVTVGKTVAVK